MDGQEDDPPIITLFPKQIRTFLIRVEQGNKLMGKGRGEVCFILFSFCSLLTIINLDTDNCADHTCGTGSSCIELPCAYSCSCKLRYHFDHATKSCVPDPADQFTQSLSDIFRTLPSAIISYLTFVCAYSIRSELKKISSISSTRFQGILFVYSVILFSSSPPLSAPLPSLSFPSQISCPPSPLPLPPLSLSSLSPLPSLLIAFLLTIFADHFC